jgi:uncharacterized protein (DUF427 family)
MPKATWNGTVLAEASPARCRIVEGNTYFPPDAIRQEHLRKSRTWSLCPWKGIARYYDVVVDGQVNRDAAWYYPWSWPFIRNYVAFWNGVEIGV